jgi:pilus assembly protein CpaF
MIKLTLTEKGGEPKLLTFDKDEITIGRVSGNDIVLAKGNVSKRHSRLAMRGGQMEVSDLKSTNGTYVNGRKIAGPTLIGPTDRVYVGDFLIGIEGADGAAFGGTDAHPSAGASGSRRLPPPPPPPRAPGGSSASRLPSEDDEGGGEDEEELGLAARPPRSRSNLPPPPPPPPPPPRRPATPLASRALEQALGDDGFEPSDVPLDDHPPHPPNLEDTGAVGLFAHSRRPDDDDESAPTRRPTANRPAAAPAPASPTTRERGASGLASVGEAGVAPGFEALLNDAGVTQILLTDPDATLMDRGDGLALHNQSLGDPNAVADSLWRYANTAYPPPPPDNPVVDVRLPDGTRVLAIFPPAAPSGVVASVRRPGLPERSLADLVPGGSRDVQTLLEGLVNARRNVVLTGDAAAIPAALGAFARAIPADRRVVAIGAGARARMGWTDLAPTPDMPGLVRVAAALRPDHLVIGEVIGPELGELVLVATRGGEGLILAMPARTPSEALGRIAALAAPALGGAVTAASLVAGAFDLCVHLVQTSEGQPRIIEVAEPRANAADVIADVALAIYNEGSKRDLGSGRLAGRGVSGRLGAAMAAAGSPLPSAVVGK